jgi:aspartate kinase
MRIYKFGGASVKDSEGVRNLARVLRHEGQEQILVVVSAMGKTTNALEEVVRCYCENDPKLQGQVTRLQEFHNTIVSDLFEDDTHEIHSRLKGLYRQLDGFLKDNDNDDYDFIYDQVVSFGEMLSTRIVSAYLTAKDLSNTWLDVRGYIKTDSTYRDARIDWERTRTLVGKLDRQKRYLTQGFLGSDPSGFTTTLGREGSDFTAAIFAYLLNADSVTIWKDVPGVLNADPRHFEATELLRQIPYSEAIEMAFYGASVIHPKTLKPLENKKIPLFVRSFFTLDNPGTTVGDSDRLGPEVPCFVLKKDQYLVAVSAKDFSFMVEHNLRDVFNLLHRHRMKVNLIQNSAISFTVCVEDPYHNFEKFLRDAETNFVVDWHNMVCLYTIRHATPEAVAEVEREGRVLLKQITSGTVQMVIDTN